MRGAIAVRLGENFRKFRQNFGFSRKSFHSPQLARDAKASPRPRTCIWTCDALMLGRASLCAARSRIRRQKGSASPRAGGFPWPVCRCDAGAGTGCKNPRARAPEHTQAAEIRAPAHTGTHRPRKSARPRKPGHTQAAEIRARAQARAHTGRVNPRAPAHSRPRKPRKSARARARIQLDC